MDLAEYATFDALGLAELVAKKQVSPKELANTALAAKAKVDPMLKAIVELYPDRIGGLDEASLGSGPFRGVPFLIKDVFGHEKGRKIEFGSRLCAGMTVETSTYFLDLLKASGLNILGRSAAPEYSMSSTTESVMFGNTSNPWKHGYSAGGSSGGAQAAVVAGIVPLAHGSDIDEGGWGYAMNLVQAKSVRDVAAILDCVALPQPGDPFLIPKPDEPYASLARKAPAALRIGIVLDELVGVKVDPEVAAAVEATGKVLAGLGHAVDFAKVDMGGLETMVAAFDLFFFGFDNRLDGYARRSGHSPGPATLEPVIHAVYRAARDITPARFIAANAAANRGRRKLGAFFATYDVWLSPTTARVAEPWGRYQLSKPGVDWNNLIEEIYKIPCQYTIPHNIMGTPAISLPLAMHSSGVPIGVQIAAKPAGDHLVLQLATVLEAAMPWRGRLPALHVSNM